MSSPPPYFTPGQRPEDTSPVRGWSQRKFTLVVWALIIGALVFWCCMCGIGANIKDAGA